MRINIAAMPSLLLIPLLLAALAAFLLYRGARGVVTLSDPTCSHCGYDLRWVTPGVNKACPECGSDLTAPHAVRFGARKRKPRLIYAGLVLVVLTVAAVPALKMLAYRNSPFNKKDLATSTLIANLATSADQPWDWQELERRHKIGQLTNEQCTAAIEELIKFIQKRPTGWNGPLVWCEAFVRAADARNAISKEQFERLAKAFFAAQPVVKVRAKVRQGRPTPFELSGSNPWPLLGFKLIYAIRSARLDKDQNVDLLDTSTFYSYQSSARDALAGTPKSERMEKLSACSPMSIRGALFPQAPCGKHTLTMEVDYGVVDESAAFENGGTPGQAKYWPKARCKWAATVSAPLEIIPKEAVVVELITRSDLDPTNYISGSATLRGTRTPGKVGLKLNLKNNGFAVPMISDVKIRMGAVEKPIGLFYGNSSLITTEFPKVPADIKSCTITLTPSPGEAEQQPDVDRIWGKEIVLKDVPVERRDLEDAADASATSAPSSQ